MVCFRCDGKGKYKNEFGIMEKCESCQGADMTLEKADPEPNADEESFWEIMNFNCVFPSCNYKHNDISEEEFIIHLRDVHHNEMLDISKKENIPITMAEMITISNSKVFINS